MSVAPHYIRGRTCEFCPHYEALKGGEGECRVDPPNAVVVGMQQAIAGGSPTPAVIMVQRRVTADGWCGKHPGRSALQWTDTEGFDRIPTHDEAVQYAVRDEVEPVTE